MAKHRRKKSKAPVDYGIVLTVATVIAGALITVRRVRRASRTHQGGASLARRSTRSASLT